MAILSFEVVAEIRKPQIDRVYYKEIENLFSELRGILPI